MNDTFGCLAYNALGDAIGINCVRGARRDAIAIVTKLSGLTWKQCYARGWRCRRVTISAWGQR